jgi:hypothetical protein
MGEDRERAPCHDGEESSVFEGFEDAASIVPAVFIGGCGIGVMPTRVLTE